MHPHPSYCILQSSPPAHTDTQSTDHRLAEAAPVRHFLFLKAPIMLKENIYISFPLVFGEKKEVGISLTLIPLEVINGVRAWKGFCG